MAHETLTPEEYAKILKSDEITKLFDKKNMATTVSSVVKSIPEKAKGMVETLTDFILVFFYFMFTGLAILFRSPIPKDWLKIVQRLNNSRINQRIDAVSEIKKEVKKPKYKVVDLDTHKSIKLPRTS
ncbi:hypothetical protein M0R04_12660 [Candidatus Dojkabacteria bacterium]|jgi:hypothetical protein|nr:hypothetical protein [Candidatus Dojkabacteria bacterium]